LTKEAWPVALPLFRVPTYVRVYSMENTGSMILY
jgi:hypothetical protein